MGFGGLTQLLSKSDGYSRIVSGFVSQEFGIGLHLAQIEMDKLKQRRISGEWGSHLSTK